MSSVYPSQYITTTGIILEQVADSAYKTRLPNGKITLAFLERKSAHLKESIRTGDTVKLRICPADFDCARIDAIITST